MDVEQIRAAVSGLRSQVQRTLEKVSAQPEGSDDHTKTQYELTTGGRKYHLKETTTSSSYNYDVMVYCDVTNEKGDILSLTLDGRNARVSINGKEILVTYQRVIVDEDPGRTILQKIAEITEQLRIWTAVYQPPAAAQASPPPPLPGTDATCTADDLERLHKI